jgi:hypothetical protein
MFIQDPGFVFFHPGSRVNKIPDPAPHVGQRIFVSLALKTVLGKIIWDVHPGSGFFFPSQIPDPGVKKSIGSGSATLIY